MEDPNEAIERRRAEEKKRKADEEKVTEAIASAAACYSRVPHAAFMKAARELLNPRTVASLVETAYFGGAVARSIHRGMMAEAAVCEWKEWEGVIDDQTFRERFAEVFPLAVAGDPPFQYLGFGAELLESPSVRHAVIDTYRDAMAGREPEPGSGGRRPVAVLREISEGFFSMRGAAWEKVRERKKKRDDARTATAERVADLFRRIDEAIPEDCTDGDAGGAALPEALREEMEGFRFFPWDFCAEVHCDVPLLVGRVLAVRQSPRRGGPKPWLTAAEDLLVDGSDAQQEGDRRLLVDRRRQREKREARKLGGHRER